MTKLEKLKIELSKCQKIIKDAKEKEKSLLDKIVLEEQREIQKLMKDNNLTFEELAMLLNKK